jgi:hypothetical protein
VATPVELFMDNNDELLDDHEVVIPEGAFITE